MLHISIVNANALLPIKTGDTMASGLLAKAREGLINPVKAENYGRNCSNAPRLGQ